MPSTRQSRGQLMGYEISSQAAGREARRFRCETAAEAVNMAIELVQAGIPNVTITDLTSGRVYRQDELSLLQAEARMRFERGSY